MPEPYSISLLNDSFPPLIDGVANTVVNYARELTKLGDRAIVVTPEHPDADDSRFPFPVARYPSVDTRRLFGYLAGYPFSPETLRQLKEQKVDLLHSHCPVMSTILARSIRDVVDAPLVFTYHTKFDVDVAKLLRGRLLQESALYVLASNISACDEVWTVSRGAGENLRAIGYEGDYIVMPNGVDFPQGRVEDALIAQVTEGYDLPENVPVFLFVGRMMWYKGIRIILEGIAKLRESGQVNIPALAEFFTSEEISHLIGILQKPESLKNGAQALKDYCTIILDEAHKRAAVNEDPLMAAMEKNKYKGNGGKQTWKKNS